MIFITLTQFARAEKCIFSSSNAQGLAPNGAKKGINNNVHDESLVLADFLGMVNQLPVGNESCTQSHLLVTRILPQAYPYGLLDLCLPSLPRS